MRKIIISPQECGILKPHWPHLDEVKLENARRLSPRFSRFDSTKIVLGSVPILLADDGYVINGKHRSFTAFLNSHHLEAYVVSSTNELQYHVPAAVLGEVGLEGALQTYAHRLVYTAACHAHGIRTISDFAKFRR